MGENMTKVLRAEDLRAEFPVLNQSIHNRPLVYFDNGATMQKPKVVIDAMSEYYETINANVHRGVHTLSQRATDAFEATRSALAAHLHAAETHEVIFTRGTTESINLVAHGFRSLLKAGDEVMVSALEHHSNIVPWQMLCEYTGAKLVVIPMLENGELDQSAYEQLLNSKTALVAVNHVSNALGTVNPVKSMIAKAHAYQAAVLIDGAQAVPHFGIDVQDLDADFYAFSAHKMYGPTGIGALYGKTEWLEKLSPYQGGGEMIHTVTFEKTTYAGLPHKFEAGTPHIEGVVAWKSAIDWMNAKGIDQLARIENELLLYGTEQLQAIPGLKIYGTAREKVSVISFLIDGIHPYDAGTILDKLGIAVRTGHHCTQPIMQYFEIPGTIRASFAAYNTKSEIDRLVEGLDRVITMLK